MTKTSPPRTALLVGATGLVGGHCLDLLLSEPAHARVVVLGRRPLGRSHPRLEERVVDFDRLEETAGIGPVDELFCALGTTIAKAGSREAFQRVDHDYPLAAARLAARGGARSCLLVSALGADPASRVFYNRVKGETEEALQRLPLERVVILRPSLLLGERTERRRGEAVATALSRPLRALMVGPLRRYRPIPAREVAAAMVRLAVDGSAGDPRAAVERRVRVVESEEISWIARSST